MHRYKIIPMTLLILSLINFLLAAPVVLPEACQEYVDMAGVPEDVILVSQSEKRSDQVENRWNKDKYSDDPLQKRGSAQGSNPAPPVGEPPTDLEFQDAASVTSPEIKQPSLNEITPSDHGYMSSDNYYASGEGGSLGASYLPSNRQKIGSFLLWDPHDWSETSSEAEKEPFMSKIKSFFVKMFNKLKFWPRGPGEL
ncbi:hypothetical protein BGY98DRAFT_978591 [Russula aff. rugulosa BPL654]|nr:hypothetical protein BGY98DRAFT_978591 [Russula aff. rugulosa BPL654]